MKLSLVKKMVEGFKVKPTEVKFLDDRIEEMKDPQGYVAPYYSFFYEFAKKFKPEVVVELGSWQGTSASCFAAGNPYGLVITVDHHTDPGDKENEWITYEAQDQFDNLFYCNGWTCNEIYDEQKDKHSIPGENAFPLVLANLEGKKIDVLFIDSWHHSKQAWKDWNAYTPLLNDGALVICDDITQGSPGGGIFDMLEGFWDKLDYDKFLTSDLHTPPFSSGYPMGFLKYEL